MATEKLVNKILGAFYRNDRARKFIAYHDSEYEGDEEVRFEFLGITLFRAIDRDCYVLDVHTWELVIINVGYRWSEGSDTPALGEPGFFFERNHIKNKLGWLWKHFSKKAEFEIPF